MSCCTSRCVLITVCVIQLVAIIERQVFDFLGYMWAPIIVNFLQIIFVIIGLFGAVQYRPKVVVVYTIWCLIWLGWNIFVICFYLEVGILSRGSDVLNIGTGNKSWWLENGPGCKVTNDSWSHDRVHVEALESDKSSETVRQSPPEDVVEGCVLQYYYVEIQHAGIQIFFTLLGLVASCIVIYVFTEEDDSSQPVHGELEYIKMRYRSPARSSFREKTNKSHNNSKNINRAYDTLNTQTSTFSSAAGETRDRHGNPIALNYNSDDSIDRLPENTNSHERITGGGGTPLANSRGNVNIDRSHGRYSPGSGHRSSPHAGGRNLTQKSPQLGSSDSARGSPRSGGREFGSYGSPGGDLGYESYDSRSQLVVGQNVGQTVI